MLLNPEDVEKLSNNISLVCNNKKIREQMITKGLQRAKTFTWKRAADLTFDLYKNISL